MLLPLSRWFLLWLGIFCICLNLAAPAPAIVNVFRFCTKSQLIRLNEKLAGRVLDFTGNHGCDRRIWSESLGQKRDLYVYLPPGYDGVRKYPMMIWLHGIGQDEKNFLFLAEEIDRAIRNGIFPPLVIVVPDGSVDGRPCLFNSGSFFVNSKAGRFEDWIARDVWRFAYQNFQICPERDAHVIAGGSMGGTGAYIIGFKHREQFGQIVGIMPGLNGRYVDCHGNYRADYDPGCVGWRTQFTGKKVLGRFAGILPVREKWLIRPLFDRGEDPLPFLIAHNLIEMLDHLAIRPNEFGLYVGYGTGDELNLDAQALQFADEARKRGIPLTLVAVPGGRHSTESTGLKLLPSVGHWLSERLQAYLPSMPTRSAEPACLQLGAAAYRSLAAAPRGGLFPTASSLPTLLGMEFRQNSE